ncbi:MAG: UDP-N-acetylmuramate--L-alanine ligase [Chitinophagales bacterium]|nr:MAG: UDP-N-acetylmuramate--L-alanine ligase [Chitinophagales bacterium]
MITLNHVKNIYFLGIGGIGMSALARYFHQHGRKIYGYDKTSSALITQLIKEGMEITFDDNPINIPEDIDLAIYTPAIPDEHALFQHFRQRQVPLFKRSEILEIITQDKFTVAVAGSHGKTTVTAMIAHVLRYAGKDPMAFLGGISLNYHTNYLHGASGIVVVEADEFDRSFLRLTPDIAVITAIDTDHLDIYKTYENIQQAFLEFAGKIKPDGCLVAQSKIPVLDKITLPDIRLYGVSEQQVDYSAAAIRYEQGVLHFNITGNDGISGIILTMGGVHNVENALAAYAVARRLGVDKEQIKDALKDFKGVKRRFEYLIRTEKLVFIDDYAHHPREISALLHAVRAMFPYKKITAVFQPHLYTRTRDLSEGFAEALNLADEVFLLPVYAAREKPIPGVSSEIIARKLNIPHKVVDKEFLLSGIKEKKIEVLLTIGAGDIDVLAGDLKGILLRSST